MDKHKHELKVKIADEVASGHYSNLVQISHTKEELVLDFMSVVGHAGSVVSRVFISPTHAKRIIKALEMNLTKHQQKYGTTIDASDLGPTGK